MSTPNASGPASSPPAPAVNGNNAAPPPDAAAPVVLSPDDVAAAAAADQADALAAAANGETPPNRREASVRIPDVIAERNAAMDYANYWRAKALEVLQPPGGQPPAASTPGASQAGNAPATRAAPKLTEFPAEGGGFDAVKWSEALTTWNGEQIEARVTAIDQQRQQQAQATTVQQSYNAKVAAFRATAPDFDIVAQNPNLPVSKHMVDAIMSADLGPQVYYHLCKNPHEAARIFRLPPQQQAAAIGKIEGRLEAATARPPAPSPTPGARPPAQGAAPARQQSRAPDPPTPVRGQGASDTNLANLPLADYLAQRLPHIARGK